MAQTVSRMNHIFGTDGKTFILAMDHGSNFNVLPAMRDAKTLIRELAAAIAKLIHEDCSVDAALKEMNRLYGKRG